MKLYKTWLGAFGFLGLSLLALKLIAVSHTAEIQNRTQQVHQSARPELLHIVEASIPESVPGAIVYAVKDGEVLLHSALGYASLELAVPMQINHSFQIGSVAKQFTAVAILQLVEQGKLTLHDPAAHYLPDSCAVPTDITVEHLLTHTSGIVNYLELPAWREQARLPAQSSEIHALYCQLPTRFPAGAAWDYSNSGYFLLADIVQQVSGQSFNAYIQEHLLDAAGLDAIWPHEASRIYPGYVNGYIAHGAGHRPADFYDPSQVLGAGSLIGTVEGLYQWHLALQRGDLLNTAQLKAAQTDYVTTSGRSTGYGYGWELKQVQGFATVEHGGYFPGYFTSVLTVPDENLFVAAFVNSRSYDPIDVTTRLAAAILGQPFPEPHYVAVTDAMVDHWQGVWVDESGVQRRIGLRNGEFYIQRGHGSAFRLLPDRSGYLHYTDSVSYLALETDAAGEQQLVLYSRAGEQSRSERIHAEAPHYHEVTLSDEQQAALSGYYQLAPEFGFELFIDKDQLYLQGTGQNAGRLMALKPLHLISEDLIAEFEFKTDENGVITHMVIHQAGQEIPATKVN
ncbi:MAG: beta-lactamase family protein [Aliidiomarina sp.]|uniref:serine hydrolase domain-containing protein n=1 Tax=Aliidiomarina sp. TaxID=1872439 RepID=UPI0025B90AF7|nr:serine hydrolase domain-containing protein [Aliidiomarina sp.]MCH8501720.1 beta-lactamase family protein [Aliidiomarina sp.]